MEELDLLYDPQYIEQFRHFIKLTSPISDTSWEEMVSIMHLRRVDKGMRLLDYMEEENAVRFLCKGVVKCEDTYNRISFVYDFKVAPIMLSEMVSFFNASPSHITLESVTECDFLELPRIPFTEITHKHVDVSIFATHIVTNHLETTHSKQALLRTLTAEERYKHFLQEFAAVAHLCKLEDVASYIDVKPQSLSRIRKNITWL